MADVTYESVSQLIDDLKDTGIGAQHPDYVNYMNFNGSFFKGIEDKKPDFWKELLQYMSNNSPTSQEDFKHNLTNIASVLDFINQKADLINDNVWSKITEKMQNPPAGNGIDLNKPGGVADNSDETPCEDYFWNESLSQAVALLLKKFIGQTAEIQLKDGVSIPLDDLKHADAAYSFTSHWVRPESNIDEETYEEVRGEDAIKSVLKNSDNMQFTRSNSNDAPNWLRLIMPKYMRSVEVEDLNRNFWVIAQVLSAICAYLFGDDSIAQMFEKILKELVGLWENCLYLWGAAAMIAQEKEVVDVHVEFTPLTNSKIYGYRKFDNFGETYTEVWSTIMERMDYLAQIYNHSHIVIIPEIRADNYKHNYYSKVQYPGMIIYNRNNGARIWVNFNVDSQYKMGENYLTINLAKDFNDENNKLYVNRIGAIRDKEIAYDFKQDFSTIAETSPYYAAIRTRIPSISVVYNNDNNSFTISDFVLKFYDAAAQAIDGNQYVVCSFAQNNALTISNETVASMTLNYVAPDPNTELVSGTLADADDVDIAHGYYLGELVSCQSILGISSYSFENNEYHGQQIYSADPSQIIGLMEAEDDD